MLHQELGNPEYYPQKYMNPKKSSIAEVVRLSGVSAATVSRVLRDLPGFSEETRRRVFEAVKKTGYEPNKRLQRHFKRIHSRSYCIQYLAGRQDTMYKNDRFFLRRLWPLEKELAARRCALVVSSVEESMLGDGSTYAVTEGFVEGVIVGTYPHLAQSLSRHVPVVMFNAEDRRLAVDSVVPDAERAIFDQMKYLHDLGHRYIACFRPHEGEAHERWQDSRIWFAYRKFLAGTDIAVPDSYFDTIHITPETNAEAVFNFVEKLFTASAPAPTAIITADVYAPWLAKELDSRGIKVPQNVSLMGYDDNVPQGLPFGLSTFRQNFDEMASVAVDLLIARLEGDKHLPRVVEVAGTLVHRDSVAPPRRMLQATSTHD